MVLKKELIENNKKKEKRTTEVLRFSSKSLKVHMVYNHLRRCT